MFSQVCVKNSVQMGANGGVHGKGVCMAEGMFAREMATEAGGTHPAGMHSCLQLPRLKLINHMCEWILSHNLLVICTWYFSLLLAQGSCSYFLTLGVTCFQCVVCL